MNPPHHRDPRPGAQAVPSLPFDSAGRHLLNDVAAGFAHELNQPLAAITAYAAAAATLLRRDPARGGEALGIVQAIAGQALRAGIVIEELRGVVRAHPTGDAPLDTNAVVRATLPLLQSLGNQRDVRLLPELRTPLPGVTGDPARLGTTLILLVDGAFDAIASRPAEPQRLVLATDCGSTDVALCGRWSLGTLFEIRLPRRDA